jgi:hypothetical protein
MYTFASAIWLGGPEYGEPRSKSGVSDPGCNGQHRPNHGRERDHVGNVWL